MRELLFRGKTERNNVWVVGNTIICDYDIHQVYIRNRSKGYDTMNWEEVQNPTIGQYTGIKDRYGNRIFEGDIVRRHTIEGYPIDLIGVVFYEEKEGCFMIRWYVDEIRDKKEPDGWRRIKSVYSDEPERFIYQDCDGDQSPVHEDYDYELLGNKFDHKEFLEV